MDGRRKYMYNANQQTSYFKSNVNRFHGFFGLWLENSIDLFFESKHTTYLCSRDTMDAVQSIRTIKLMFLLSQNENKAKQKTNKRKQFASLFLFLNWTLFWCRETPYSLFVFDSKFIQFITFFFSVLIHANICWHTIKEFETQITVFYLSTPNQNKQTSI